MGAACSIGNGTDTALAKEILGNKPAAQVAARRLSTLAPGKQGAVWVFTPTQDVKQIFRFGRQLNKGHFGVIFEVSHIESGERFACKVISKRKLLSVDSVKDVRREVQILHHLRGHPNVVDFHAAYEDEHDVYLVMELCEGGDLFEKIEAQVSYTEQQVAGLFRQMVEIVSYCHDLGVMHRDIKPENFLLTSRSDASVIKLSDFGLGAFFREDEPLAEVVGSACYMAPELLARNYNKAADVWSLGVILHVMLSGYTPFKGDSDQAIFAAIRNQRLDLTAKPWPSISRHARHLVTRLLERDPDQRIRLTEVLVHPWLRPDGTAPARALPSSVRLRLAHFHTYHKFKKEARRALAAALPPEEVLGLRLMFEELDADHDGLITLEEMREGLRRKGEALSDEDVQSLMQAADLNCDGVIDYKEFIAATYNLSKLERDDLLFKAFKHFDKDDSGFIEKHELRSALESSTGGGPGKDVETILAEVDADGDGKINYKEFCDMLKDQGPLGGGSMASLTTLLLPAAGKDMEVTELDANDIVETTNEGLHHAASRALQPTASSASRRSSTTSGAQVPMTAAMLPPRNSSRQLNTNTSSLSTGTGGGGGSSGAGANWRSSADGARGAEERQHRSASAMNVALTSFQSERHNNKRRSGGGGGVGGVLPGSPDRTSGTVVHYAVGGDTVPLGLPDVPLPVPSSRHRASSSVSYVSAPQAGPQLPVRPTYQQQQSSRLRASASGMGTSDGQQQQHL